MYLYTDKCVATLVLNTKNKLNIKKNASIKNTASENGKQFQITKTHIKKQTIFF